MAWHVVSFPPAARAALRKHGKADFSLVQKIRAAVRHYTTLPLSVRLQLGREYRAGQLDHETAGGLAGHSGVAVMDCEDLLV
jgi:hypothetical protein